MRSLSVEVVILDDPERYRSSRVNTGVLIPVSVSYKDPRYV